MSYLVTANIELLFRLPKVEEDSIKGQMGHAMRLEAIQTIAAKAVEDAINLQTLEDMSIKVCVEDDDE